MACSQYEYVKKFEQSPLLLPNTYIVIRIDGKGFTKFTSSNNFEKPNDKKGLDLMNKAAEIVMQSFSEISLAYGQSDEFSFVFPKNAQLYQRRADKIISCIVSCFTSAYVSYFEQFFNKKSVEMPMFDARAVCYPDFKNLRDYFAWRQVDCHINNLYNTCFWNMVQVGGKSNQEAQIILKDTFSDQKNEILFSQFGINYSKIEEQFRKGTTLIRNIQLKEKFLKMEVNNLSESEEQQKNVSEKQENLSEQQEKLEEKFENLTKKDKKKKQKIHEKKEQNKYKQIIQILSDDIISINFWNTYKEQLKLE